MIKPLWAALLLASAQSVFADPLWQDDLNWVKTMAFAAHQTDYSGIFLYQHDNQVETSHISHVVDRDGEYGRLEGLDGARRKIIRSKDQVWCYLGDRKVRVEGHQGGRRFPAVLPEQLSLVNGNYLIKQTEEGRIAGFHAHAVVFMPRDSLRYARRMWAHSDSGLLLKEEVLDESGRVIEQSAFIQLTIGEKVDRSWVEASKKDIASLAHDMYQFHSPKTKSLVNANGWRVDMLPPGFKKITEMYRPLPGKNIPAFQMVFSDGLASISIFIESIYGDQEEQHGLASQGATQVYSKVSGEHLLTVVGEVPPRTVMQVADSVRRSRE